MFYNHLVHWPLGNWNITRHMLLTGAQICMVGEEKVRGKSRGIISQKLSFYSFSITYRCVCTELQRRYHSKQVSNFCSVKEIRKKSKTGQISNKQTKKKDRFLLQQNASKIKNVLEVCYVLGVGLKGGRSFFFSKRLVTQFRTGKFMG